MVYLAEL